MNKIQCKEYTKYIRMNRIQCIEYNEWKTMRRIRFIIQPTPGDWASTCQDDLK
jgi:hypothetical protein